MESVRQYSSQLVVSLMSSVLAVACGGSNSDSEQSSRQSGTSGTHDSTAGNSYGGSATLAGSATKVPLSTLPPATTVLSALGGASSFGEGTHGQAVAAGGVVSGNTQSAIGAMGGAAGAHGLGTASGGSVVLSGTTSGILPSECAIIEESVAPIGYGSATTGGGAVAAKTVATLSAAQAELSAYAKAGGKSGLVLKYTGAFDFGTISDPCEQHSKSAQTLEIKEVSGVTLVGAIGSAANFGIHITKASNIIIQNMKIGLLPGGGASDAISIEGASSQIWIDHNELFSSLKECSGAGDVEFDGLLDTKAESHHITVSYNYFHDHHKVGLNGSGDSDSGDRYITFHHNRYENVGSRTPLQRFGVTHIFNNYYNQIAVSGINVRMGGVSLIESNYFENCANPITSRDSKSIGYWDLRNNFVGEGITWSAPETGIVNATDWKTTKAFTDSLGYTYAPDNAACVKEIVIAKAGATL